MGSHTYEILLAVGVLTPMLSFWLLVFFGPSLGKPTAGWLGVALGMGVPLVMATIVLVGWQFFEDPASRALLTENAYRFHWADLGTVPVTLGVKLDSLTVAMYFMVTFIAFWIFVFSLGYMSGHSDEVAGKSKYHRFFCYLSLFGFSMLGLVISSSLLFLFIFWELVGLCSYLLIGFYFDKGFASRAAMKAFITNRVGDFGFLIGLMLVYFQLGTLDLDEAATRFAEQYAAHTGIFASSFTMFGWSLATIMGVGLFCGAMGKSAQFPLHVWLPDAMAGPTPVSALIHAATMVTAGVYLIARNATLFALAPATMATIAIVGTVTALFAATIAVTQNDIKKVLAYSTISQLGYMFMALGTGAFGAAVFHLMTHAFFKALLFLGAGSVIHGMGNEQDMRKMGNLRHAMPTTFAVMAVGALAIAGIPGLSGFFSKDEILWAAFEHGGGVNLIYLAGLLTAGLTAFYMARMIMMTFFGQSRWANGKRPHESPSVMTLPLIILAFLSIAGGYLGVPEALGGHNLLHHFLAPVLTTTAAGGHMANEALEMLLMLVSVGVAGSGIYLAFRIYIDKPEMAATLQEKFPLLHRLSANKFYVDEIYRAAIVRPFEMVSELLWKGFDVKVIDAAVNGAGRALSSLGGAVRMIQTGRLQHYASMLLLGVAFILIMIMAS
ncbi:MAG: NADH-quinone oxidoreductase subunit L [Candidatus Marinimicrobia bacterium]|nr:NADH-quinone oxidoreductase subunit L [Candidatus Neomarinimicrobiota bacterium]